MPRGRKILLGAVAAVVVVALVVGWSVWRRQATSSPTAIQSTSTATQSAMPSTHSTDDENSQLESAAKTAVTFEGAILQWGSPTVYDSDKAGDMSETEAMKAFRTPSDSRLTEQWNTLSKVVATGADLTIHDPSDTPDNMPEVYTSWGDYWANQWYGFGVNVIPGTLNAASYDRQADGTILVKLSAEQQIWVYSWLPSDEKVEGYWNFAPACGWYAISDEVTVNSDGTKVVGWKHVRGANEWFQSPFLRGFTMADGNFTNLHGADTRMDDTTSYKGDEFNQTKFSYNPDPLFTDSRVAQIPQDSGPQQ